MQRGQCVVTVLWNERIIHIKGLAADSCLPCDPILSAGISPRELERCSVRVTYIYLITFVSKMKVM